MNLGFSHGAMHTKPQHISIVLGFEKQPNQAESNPPPSFTNKECTDASASCISTAAGVEDDVWYTQQCTCRAQLP
eukprot:798764-Ditylum_brightwellii.AAC.1